MLKKGLVALVCLAIMTSLWSWAATSYIVQTKVSNTGGTMTARGVPQSSVGTVYRTYTTSKLVPMSVARGAGYRISALQRNGQTVALGNYTAHYASTFLKGDGTSQSLTAAFAAIPVPPVQTVTWSMQTVIYGASGKISTTRDGVTVNLTTPNQLVTRNYTDTVGAVKAMTATVTADAGYKISSISATGTVIDNNGTVAHITSLPAGGLSVNYVTANFAKTTSTVSAATNSGIAPTSASVQYGGSLVLTATPTGTNNVVESFSAPGATVALSDRNGIPISLPYKGPVTATLSNITGNVAVSATYSANTVDAMYTNCTVACHLIAASANVRSSFDQWNGSKHQLAQQDCVTCHSTMPGGVVRESVDANTFQVTAASAGTVGTNYCARCHAASVNTVLASVHYTMPSGKLVCTSCHAAGHNPQFNAEACAGCHAVVNNHNVATTGTKTCIECHDKHNPTTVTGTLGPVSAHPAVTLYTYEEIGMQMAGGAQVPVQVDANGKGMPYSPKQTCGTAGCHVKNGIDYTYDKISDHAFHSNEGRSEYQDAPDGKFNATKNKPWTQSTAMVGKW